MAEFVTVTKGAANDAGSFTGLFKLRISKSLEDFCNVCPSGDHPEPGFACEWQEHASPPDLSGEPFQLVTVVIEGTGVWSVVWTRPNGEESVFQVTAGDSPIDVPTGGQFRNLGDLSKVRYFWAEGS